MKNANGFTLIELLIVIAIMGILAAAILVAINPGKRLAQARDAQRKSAVSTIANALVTYYTIVGKYPQENTCDTSRGAMGDSPCNVAVTGDDWNAQWPSYLYDALIISQEVLKELPKDPINNTTFYYKYEPSGPASSYCTLVSTPCYYYWIGARMEAVDDPSKKNKMIFRCTDRPAPFSQGTGCKEIEFPNADPTEGPVSFDTDSLNL